LSQQIETFKKLCAASDTDCRTRSGVETMHSRKLRDAQISVIPFARSLIMRENVTKSYDILDR